MITIGADLDPRINDVPPIVILISVGADNPHAHLQLASDVP
ncbi:hypothetical protein [Paraburkholderia caribensis]|nr:hypothetical protein [Paraburkholderia caribensis]